MIQKNTNSDLLNGYDQSSPLVMCSISDPELQMEMQSLSSVSVEALRSTLLADEAKRVLMVQASMNIAERHARMEFAQ